MTDRALQLGVLGCGAISQFAHVSATQRARRVKLVALCDAAEDLLNRVADRANVPHRYTDYQTMLAEADVEAVLVAAPDPFHVALAQQALAAGKHVLVEKPLGTHSAECRQLVAAVRHSGLKLQVGSMKRHDPGVAFAQQFVRQKAGRILSVSGVYRDTIYRPDMQQACLDPLVRSTHTVRPREDPKADRDHYNLTTQGVHLFDTLRYLAGDVTALTAHTVCSEGNRTWHGVLELADGGCGHFELTCKCCGDWCERYEVYGQTGSVQVEVALPFYHRPAQARCFDGRTQQWSQPLGGLSNAYANQLDAFATAVLDDRPTSPDVYDGLAAVLLLEAVEQAAQTGQRITITHVQEAVP